MRGGKGHKGRGGGAKRKRSNSDSDSSVDSSARKKQDSKKKPRTEQSQQQSSRRFTNSKPVIKTREFKRKLWSGPAGDENPSEEVKLLRKSIGVNVKGNCKECPPPVSAADDASLPKLFRDYWSGHSLSTLTPVQMQSWPAIMNGANLISISPTGSGKTLAYLLPAIHHILSAPTTSSANARSNKVQPTVLVLAPARELAIQIHQVAKSCRQIAPQVKAGLLYGGQEKQQQMDTLRALGNQCKVLVATPGRLLDILQDPECPLDLSNVSYQVIDEADRMLAMGFMEQLQDLASYMHESRQMLLFSATFPGKLRDVSAFWVPDHVMIRCNTVDVAEHRPVQSAEAGLPSHFSVAASAKAVSTAANSSSMNQLSVAPHSDTTEQVETNQKHDLEDEDQEPDGDRTEHLSVGTTAGASASALTVSPSITQLIHVCAAHKKPRLLIKFIERIRAQEKAEKKRQADPMIIFCNKIKTLGYLLTFLKKQKIAFATLHSHIPQAQRETNLAEFKSGKVNILISTDVAARGIHIKRLRYVVNYDFPTNLEQYCHRIGRCGRQGAGLTVTSTNSESGEAMTGFAYSLMTRNMAPLAKDLIALVESVNQRPEPNLVKLAEDHALGVLSEGGGDAEGGEGDGDGEGEGEEGDDDGMEEGGEEETA